MNGSIAKNYCVSSGVGVSNKRLPSFDKSLLAAGVGNYNLVKLSSILPARCVEKTTEDLHFDLREGSILPVAYATITSDKFGEMIASAVAIGIPKDKNKVGVIMEFSAVGMNKDDAWAVVRSMVDEAFEERGWELDYYKGASVEATVSFPDTQVTTFACVAEW